MMNGKIWVESESGKGSSFIFTAEFGLEDESEKRVLAPSIDLQGMKVLVVDDNAASREILQESLESFSFEVSVSSSGQEGIDELGRAAKDEPYELVLMDWQMPGMDGVKASKLIKGKEELTKTPTIIMVTGNSREEVTCPVKEVGLEGFLIKPINPSTLLESIMEVFGKKVEKRVRRGADSQVDTEALKTIQGAQILLVDDNEINQEVGSEILEQAGFCVTIANNGQEAVDKVMQVEFDCVLMDIQMPVMDGYEATRNIRRQNRFASMPIIAMTANAMQGDKEKCVGAGMNDHVAKPINPKELFSALINWVSVREGLGQDAVSSSGTTPLTLEENILPELPGIDVDNALARVSGNEKLYRKLLGNFYKSNINTRMEIEKALEVGDTTLAERLVHTVKGVSATIGANGLAEVSQPLETELNKGNNAIDDKLWDDFWNNLDEILSTIKLLEPREDQDHAEELDLTKIKLSQSLIDQMKENVNGGMLMELEQYFSEIENRGPGGQRLAERLKELTDQFDDEGILKILEQVEIE